MSTLYHSGKNFLVHFEGCAKLCRKFAEPTGEKGSRPVEIFVQNVYNFIWKKLFFKLC